MENNKSLEQYRQETADLCQELIDLSDKIISEKQTQSLSSHNVAISYRSYAENVQEICKVDKYDICFVGQYGIGKTTFLSSFLGLIDKEKLLSSEKKKIQDCCLLETEAGQTTLCKMKIFLNAKESKFVIVGATLDAFKSDLLSFVNYIYNSTSQDENKDILFPEEKVRAIRNMVGIDKNLSTLEDIQEELPRFLGIQVLPDSLDKDKIVEKLLEKSNYTNRNELEIKFNDSKQFPDFSRWLKDYSKAINNCELKNSPLPVEINLYLSSEDLNITFPDYVGSIIDTRGMKDRDEIRDDIHIAMRSINSLQVFCTSAKDIEKSPEIRRFLIEYLDDEKKVQFSSKYRTFVCVLEKDDDITVVSRSDSRETGIVSLTEKVQRYYAPASIGKSNILFQNTFPIADDTSTSGKIFSVKEDFETILIEERKKFFIPIENSLCDMFSTYVAELENRIKELKIKRSEQVQEESCIMFREAYNWVQDYKVESDTKSDLVAKRNKLSSLIRNSIRDELPPPTLSSAITYRGVNDIYWKIQFCGESVFENECKFLYDQIEGALGVIFKKQDSDYSMYLKGTLDRMEQLYNDCFRECGTFFYNTSKERLYHDNKLWDYLCSLWGNTIPGEESYRSKVANYLQDYICKNGLIDALISRDFLSEFFDAFLNYLNPNK